jgi:hypothetical protein
MDTIQEWLAAVRHGDHASTAEARLRALESDMGLRLPDPVRLGLTTAYRPEGFIGSSYIAFFSMDDVAQRWRDAQRTAPGFVPFASNGAGKWYGLDSRLKTPPFLLMPAIGSEWPSAILLGARWEEFWETLRRGALFDRVYTSAPE